MRKARHSTDPRRIVGEAIGTYFLVLIGPGAAMVNAASSGVVSHVGIALAFACVVTAMIFTFGHISGAHINPAVTIALWSVRRFPARDVLSYVVAQCLGAIAASATLSALLGAATKAGVTLPGRALGIEAGGALVIEWLLSFALMLVIIAVATAQRVLNGFAAIAVGLTVGLCALMGGPLTGASMNPARSLGPAVISGLWYAHWVYWIAPISGMIAAAHCYEYLRGTHTAGPAPAAAATSFGLEGPLD